MDVWENNYIKEDDIYTELLFLVQRVIDVAWTEERFFSILFKAAMLAPMMKGRRYTKKRRKSSQNFLDTIQKALRSLYGFPILLI